MAEWPKLSDREIAKAYAVGHPFVGDIRKQLESDSSCAKPETRIGADGKERRLPKHTSLPSLKMDGSPRCEQSYPALAQAGTDSRLTSLNLRGYGVLVGHKHDDCQPSC
jgi:hypothetical protein